MYIKSKIFSEITNSLIDTGASRSLINAQFLKQINDSTQMIVENNTCSLKGVSGNVIKSVGILKNVPVTIENFVTDANFIIVDDLSESVILGIDFIDKIKAKIDYQSHTFSNNEFTAKLIKVKQLDSSHFMYTLKTLQEVKVKSEKEILCTIEGNQPFVPKEYMYFPDPDLWQHGKKLQSQGCEIMLTQPKFYTKIYNPNKSTVILPKGTILGKFCPVSSVKITTPKIKESDRIAEIIKALKIEENDYLNSEQISQVMDLVKEYNDIFALNRSEIGICNLMEHEIKTKTDTPVVCKFRKIPLHLLKDVEAEISDLLSNNIIEHSESPYSSPAFIIRRNSKTRLIIDYRILNQQIDRSQNPVPAASTVLGQIGSNNRYFNNFDMKDGYFQVKLTEESKIKTAFSVPLVGHFQWVTTPLGVSSAPPMFQSLIHSLLKNIGSSIALGYLDDIISTSQTFDSGLQNLKTLFSRFREANLKLNPAKCKIMVPKLKFLGAWLSSDGISTDEDKIDAIVKMSAPRTKKQCQAILGCINFFRSHIRNLAAILKPISDTLVSTVNGYKWTSEANTAFEAAKKALVSAEVLIFPDINLPMHLYTDSSEIAIGGTIMQKIDNKMRPICYGSRVLQPAERNYSTVKKELLALKHFVKLWYYYLIGKTFTAHVDARTLTGKNFLSTTNCSTLLRWLMELMEFKFDLKYETGKTNVTADMLSRLPATSDQFYNWYKNEVNPEKPREAVIKVVQVQPSASISNQDNLVETKSEEHTALLTKSIAELQSEDPVISTVVSWIRENKRPDKIQNFTDMDLKTYYEKFNLLTLEPDDTLKFEFFNSKTQKKLYLVCVPKVMRTKIIQLNHDNPTGGHLGHQKCLYKIRNRYYWPAMSKEIENYVQLCEICFRTNLKFMKKPKNKFSIFTANYPGEFLCCDLVGPLTQSKGYKWIVTMTDKFSRYSRAVPIINATSEKVAKVLVNEWISHEGLFRILLTDQGANLTTSKIMIELYNVLQIDKRRTTGYRPSVNGMVERYNRSLITILKKYVQEFPNTWSDKLKLACLAYNTAIHEGTQLSPFLIMRGRECTLPHDLLFDTQTTTFYRDGHHYQAETYFKIKKIWDIARENNLKYCMQVKRRHDQKLKDQVEYKPNDLVLIWKPIKESSYRKFRNNFIGPFKVISRIADYNYKVLNEKTGKIMVTNFEAMRRYSPDLRKPIDKQTKDEQSHVVLNNSEDSDDDLALESPKFEITSPQIEEINETTNSVTDTQMISEQVPDEVPSTSTNNAADSNDNSSGRPKRTAKQPDRMKVSWNTKSY